MFESIRNHQRLLQLALVILIFPAFAFFGLPAYDRMTGGDSVASVAGNQISMFEFEQAQREQMDRLRQSLGDAFDPDMLQEPAVQREILESLITRHTLFWAAREEGIAVTDDELRRLIIGIPGLSDEDGRFDRERYADLLAARGMSEAGFEAEQRRELAIRALPESIGLTAVPPGPMVERLLLANEQVRTVSMRGFRADDYVASTESDEADFRKYFEENPLEFQIPEFARVEYIVLRPEDIAAGIELDPAAVRDYYEQNQARFGTPEERRASHILVDIGDAGRDAARARIDSLEAEIEAGKAFDAVARESSDDSASGEAGGDLGWFRHEDMISEVADAAFGLDEVGATAGPVESEFGWHLVRLDGIREAQTRPFEEVREEITQELREQQARLRYGEAAEDFSNMVYEQADTLAPAAEHFGLEINTVDEVRRSGTDDPSSPLNRPAVLRAIFSPQSLSQRQNTEAIDIGDSTLVAARVLDFQPARMPEYQEVEAEVAARVKALEAARLAREAGEAALAEAREVGAQAEGFDEELKISRMSAASLGADAVQAIFGVAADELPGFVGVPQGASGYAIFKVSEIENPDAERIDERLRAYRDQAADLYGQAETAAVFELLRARADVKVNLGMLERPGDEEDY
ncbi:MAG: SurA N-terminal domain-containing protein [Burkholderiaceae bacterium]